MSETRAMPLLQVGWILASEMCAMSLLLVIILARANAYLQALARLCLSGTVYIWYTPACGYGFHIIYGVTSHIPRNLIPKP